MTRSPNPTIILAVAAFGVFVAADDLTAVSTMFRQIIFDLEIPLPDQLDEAVWIVNAYLIAYVAVMPLAGRLSDIWGRRPVFIASLFLFLAGSIWIPLATTLNAFIAGRVVAAIGGGAIVPIAMAIVSDVYAAERRPSKLGILGAVETMGWVWGPLYGALLVRYLSWHWLFYLNIPLAIIGIAAAWWGLRGLPPPARRTSIDWGGAAALTVALVALNVALLNSGNISAVDGFADLTGERSPLTWPFYLLGAVSLVVFFFIQRRAANPLIDASLWRRPNFSPAMFINLIAGSVLIIAMVNVPLVVNVLEFDLGQAALDSGRVLSAMTAAMALMAYVGGRLTERWSYRPATVAGLTAAALAFALMGSRWTAETGYGEMGWQLALLGVGFGLIIAPTAAAAINAAPDDQRGVAAGLVILFRLMGMSVGLSALTAWGLYRFEALRVQLVLPPLTDPTFQTALVQALTDLTVAILAETFLISAGVLLLALVAAFRLVRHLA